MKARTCIIAVVLVALSASAMALPTRYTVTDLGVGSANAINDNGQIVISQSTSGSVIWDNGALTPIYAGGGSEYVINSIGQVAFCSTSSGLYLWTDGTLVQVVAPGTPAHVLGLNDSGVVVGSYGSMNAVLGDAFSWQDGTATKLGSTYQTSAAYDVNNSGLIVGWVSAVDGKAAVTWQNQVMTTLPNVPGMWRSVALKVNNRGQVAGYSYTSTGTEVVAFWKDGGVLDLGAGPTPRDMNDNGQILTSTRIWEEGTGWVSLTSLMDPASPYSGYISAYHINNRGCIIGSGHNVDGTTHSLLLTPVPEPTSLLVLASGLGLLAPLVRRRR